MRNRAFGGIPGAGPILLSATLALAMAAAAWGEMAASPQEVKAAFIFKFTSYIEWPAESFRDSHSPLVIAAPEKSPIYPPLAMILKGKTYDGRPIRLAPYVWPADVPAGAHLALVDLSSRDDVEKTVAAIRKAAPHAMLITSMEGMAKTGAMLNFITAGDRIRFEINLEEAKAAGLVISSKLLSLATIVGPVEEER
jgi:hypothetical protein